MERELARGVEGEKLVSDGEQRACAVRKAELGRGKEWREGRAVIYYGGSETWEQGSKSATRSELEPRGERLVFRKGFNGSVDGALGLVTHLRRACAVQGVACNQTVIPWGQRIQINPTEGQPPSDRASRIEINALSVAICKCRRENKDNFLIPPLCFHFIVNLHVGRLL